jgi:geranylgeranyl diphosphate synthase type I
MQPPRWSPSSIPPPRSEGWNRRRRPAIKAEILDIVTGPARVSYSPGKLGPFVPAHSWSEAAQRWGAPIEQRLGSCLDAMGLLRPVLRDHLAPGEKHFCALVPVWVCANLGGRPEAPMDLGIGLELIHNASQIHSDIRTGAAYRRGAITAFRRWGIVQADNAAGALVLKALEVINQTPAGAKFAPVVSSMLLEICQGRAMEHGFHLPHRDPTSVAPTFEAWKTMAAKKTGALYQICFWAGAAAAEVSADAIEQAASYGALFGLLVQAQEDYLDRVQSDGRHPLLRASSDDRFFSPERSSFYQSCYEKLLLHPMNEIIPGLAENFFSPIARAFC